MQNQKGVSTLILIIIIIAVAIVAVGGVFAYQYFTTKTQLVGQTQQNQNQNNQTVQPLITVTSPNGGEQWVQGSTHNITWTTSIHSKLGIQLSLADINGSFIDTINKDLIPDNGNYSWTIDNLTAPGNYKILASIYDAGPLGQDYSNNYFSIVASTDQTAGWKTYEDVSQGFSFKYPEITKSYVLNQQWPPKVTIDSHVSDYYCAVQNKKIINNNEYCVVKTSDAAAGTSYSAYSYTTIKSGKLLSLTFSLGFPNCDNYGDSQIRTACKKDQNDISSQLDQTIDRIVSTFKFTK